MNPKVSVVVPIYGVEKYLRQCVDSILSQTLKEIEVILVDDGSPDGCPAIVDEYAAKDSRVVAVHQENGGYGRAVNHGIELAKGEYIGIVESDDWIEPEMYEKLYEKAKLTGVDLVKSQFYIYNSAKVSPDKIFDSERQNLIDAPVGVFAFEEWPKILTYHASIWSNLYRASFIKDIKLIETRSASYQDFPFMCECYCRAKTMAVVKEPLVHYRMEEDQGSSTIRRDERLLLMPEQCINGMRILKSYGKFDLVKKEFHYHAFVACLGFYRTIEWSCKRAFMEKLQEVFQELRDLSQNRYFTPAERWIIHHIKSGHLIRSLFSVKDFKRMILSVKASRIGIAVTILGIRIVWGKCKARPALITIQI
jgi:glycosyltransferase involved in cell wall biosynthesis